jgi:hypothetical protein
MHWSFPNKDRILSSMYGYAAPISMVKPSAMGTHSTPVSFAKASLDYS